MAGKCTYYTTSQIAHGCPKNVLEMSTLDFQDLLKTSSMDIRTYMGRFGEVGCYKFGRPTNVLDGRTPEVHVGPIDVCRLPKDVVFGTEDVPRTS